MGLAERALPPVDGTMEPIAGIQLRAPLRPIYTKPLTAEKNPEFHGRGEEEEEEISTTPTAAEARIPANLRCPPAPRKRKPSPKCGGCGGDRARVFFNPPDLETVFIRHV